ncbi:hypothetical protein GOODEAATRI_008321, partial [Goodea atripinnis]
EAEPTSKPDEILESTVDATEWRLEVERVLPQLKVTIRTDNKVRAQLNCSRFFCVDVCSNSALLVPPGLEDPSGPDASTQRRDQVFPQRDQERSSDSGMFERSYFHLHM